MNHNNYIENVINLKRKLDKGVSHDKTLHILHKLQKIPISEELLQQTRIGKTIRHLSKMFDNDIGKTAKLLRHTWKANLKEQQQQQQRQQCFDNNYTDASTSDKRRNKFEDFLGLNDEIIRNNKKTSSNKKSDSSSTKNKTQVNDLLLPELISIKQEKYSDKQNKKSDSSSSKNKTHVNHELFPIKEENYAIKQEKSSSLTADQYRNTNTKSIEKDIMTSLASPNYKPFPNRELIDERVESNKRKTASVIEDLSMRVQSKKGRTAVFAGNARTNYTHVLKLEDICLNVLMDNIDKIYSVGDAPYFLIKPVLRKCNPKQLARIEKFNPQLIIDEDTDELWKEFCNKEFKIKELDYDQSETWRDLYFLSLEEREDKLKQITANIKRKEAKAVPVRQTQIAFSNNDPKPPREVLRKQEKAAANNGRISNGYSGSSSNHNGSGSMSANCVKLAPEKPKVGPLMKKALKMQRSRYRR